VKPKFSFEQDWIKSLYIFQKDQWEKVGTTSIAVNVKSLSKKFGNIEALSGITFSIRKGEVYGLIGPNGAGKTTTLRILSTLILPNTGIATIFGLDVVKQPEEVRKILSYLPEEAGAYRNLSGLEYLQFMARFSDQNADKIVEEASEISGLGERLEDKAKTYSKGMKRRLLLARALMTRPKLAILDEPASGLDVLHAYHVRRVIKSYVKQSGVTVLLSSHNMLEVEYLCDRVALVNKGEIVLEGNPADLKAQQKSENLEEVFAKVVGFA
jgi:ABC-2 type transport system ATP-binding protein